MPELPEIETIKNGISKIINCQINQVFQSNYRLRINSTLELPRLQNCQILDIQRRARYLIMNLSSSYSLIIHLGMSGRITLSNNFSKLKHDHFACQLSNQQWLIYNDPRRFGFVDLVLTANLPQHPMLRNLGVEPLSEDFNEKYLANSLKSKSLNIKTTIMDNKIVVGVGNIYANESLFDARISPLRTAQSLSKSEITKLTKSIKKIIKNAIEMGGSSISDYQNAEGEFGSFQLHHQVYGRNQQKCFTCNNQIIRIVQNQRSSFFCDNCQK